MPTSTLLQYLFLFGVSMLPIVELRGAMLLAAPMDLPFWPIYFVTVLGNILPVPLLIPFSRILLGILIKIPKIGPFFDRYLKKAEEKAKSEQFSRYELLALYIFVAIPLPGTGAWTGSVIAAILGLNKWKSFAAIALGVATAGIIMGILSYGLLAPILALFTG